MENKNKYITESELSAILSGKADRSEMLSLAALKANKQQISEFISEIVFKKEFERLMSTKSNYSDMLDMLENKANKSEVYTITEIHRVLMDFVGATAVDNIAIRDSLEPGMYPFVWVHDASDDPSPNIKNPALYHWFNNSWIYLGSIGEFVTSNQPSVDVSKFEIRLSEIAANVAANAEEINKIKSVFREIKEKINDNTEKINTTISTVTSNSESINGIKSSIENINTSVNEFRTGINDLSNNFSTSNTRLGTLESTVQSIQSEIGDNVARLNAITGQ